MALQKQERIIVKLAKILANEQPGSITQQKILSLICEGFAFDCAFLYESYFNKNNLRLIGSVASSQLKNAPEIFSPEFCEDFTQKTVRYCDEQLDSNPEHIQWMTLFGAPFMVVSFLADENNHIYSLIALCCTAQKEPLDDFTRENLETALSMMFKDATIGLYKSRLQFSQTALESILDNTGIDIYVNDFYTNEILYVNESMAKPYGGKKVFSGRKCWEVLFPGQTEPCEFCPQNELLDENGSRPKVYTWDYQRVFDGSWFRVFSAVFRWADGRLAHVVSSADITDNKNNEEIIRYMANYDVLTNLPNRRMLVTDCEKRINKEIGELEFLLFFDIDGFKNINDSFGHNAGDEFLVELGKFFTGIPLLKNSIYRNGGDEFVAMLGKGITADHVFALSRFIHSRFEKSWELTNAMVKCGISIGVSHYPEDGLTAEELLRKADQAMYRVKKSGGGGLQFTTFDI